MDRVLPQLHLYQKEILKKLLKAEKLRFSELNIEGLESEHMNYHLKKLVDLGFVEKDGNFYQMTDQGKDYSNMLDDEILYIEKQPKSSVIVNAVRLNEDNEVEFLMNRRLRQPYIGKVGRMGGKVRFDETLWEAAQRELYEEAGLEAKELTLEEVYHKIRYREDGDIVQNVVFYIFFAKDLSGDFIERTQWQENFWATKKDLEESDQFDIYEDLVLENRLEPKDLEFNMTKDVAVGY